MPHILTGILSLIQYKNDIESNFREALRPERCECCGKANLHRHGTYPRQSAGGKNNSEASINPIKIQRYYCPSCRKTMSVLPECIPRKRWYLWSVQHVILLLFLQGESITRIAKTESPSRHTISRWVAQFKNAFLVHRDTLIRIKTALSQYVTFHSFWLACLDLMNLSEAMRLCHVSGVLVP
jgi:transposase-like protein